LKALDKAFENNKGVFYIRYMDDWVILTNTRKQYRKAIKKMHKVLEQLKLKLSPHKTKMGRLSSFHFLG
jgi:hypothetical protein